MPIKNATNLIADIVAYTRTSVIGFHTGDVSDEAFAAMTTSLALSVLEQMESLMDEPIPPKFCVATLATIVHLLVENALLRIKRET